MRNGIQSTVRTEPWHDIVAYYDDLVLRHHLPFEPMRVLVHRLAGSSAAAELYPSTSMHTLCINNQPVYRTGEGVLHVAFSSEPAVFTFSYSQYPTPANTMTKQCSVEEAWDTLGLFLRYKFGTLLPNDLNA